MGLKQCHELFNVRCSNCSAVVATNCSAGTCRIPENIGGSARLALAEIPENIGGSANPADAIVERES